MDRAPVLALTGQVDTQVLAPGAFQEVDLAAAFEAVAGWSQTVLPGSRHAELTNLAVKHTLLKREVAHLILPNEVQTFPVAEDEPAGGPEGRMPRLEIAPAPENLAAALDLLHQAKRPVILVGHGARFAENCGGFGARVASVGQLDEALARAQAFEGPALVEIATDSELI